MSAILVGSPSTYPAELASFRTAMNGFTYTDDNKYSSFRSGDKVAEYGLTALIVGGAAAVATKSGLLKGLGKLLIPILAAGAALLRKLFGGSKAPEEA
jgi:uncharacterized membrane-anchored protein